MDRSARSTLARLGLAAVAMLGLSLRWWKAGELSLCHFDEGVLVSGAFGVRLHGLWHFPLAQRLQAPPLVPWMVAGLFRLTAVESPIMAIYLSAALGSATIVVYYLLLRRLYGVGFALAGAGLLAASDLHIAFSRMALTDVPLTFWFVAGAYFFTRAVQWQAAMAKHDPGHGRWPIVGWALAFGLAAGAAWNTKYNGWMLIAIAATTWLVVAGRQQAQSLLKISRESDSANDCFQRPQTFLAIALATLAAVVCFAPWYWHVELNYADGFRAVTENHLRYVGGIADWPGRAARLWISLGAFRHLGWLAALVTLVMSAVWHVARRVKGTPLAAAGATVAVWPLIVAVCGLFAAAVSGLDANLLLLAGAAIVPAVVWGRWPEVMFAVWTGAFLITTPFYHPYTRLLVPALPGAIALGLWFLRSALAVGGEEDAEGAHRHPRMPPFALRSVLAIVLVAAVGSAWTWHPFGLLPSRGAWQRWSTRQSYRALGEATSNLAPDVMVLCQGLPAMTLYLGREWTPLEWRPFDVWLPRIEAHRGCYLAVDFWGLYGEGQEEARAGFLKHLECLEPVATVANDLNLATLLDYMPAAGVAEHVSKAWPLPHRRYARGRPLMSPAPLNERWADVIVLYRIDRDCTKLLDRARSGNLK